MRRRVFWILSVESMKKITTIILTALLIATHSCKQGSEKGTDQDQGAKANAENRIHFLHGMKVQLRQQ